jgi:hypothetical protein
LWHQQQHQVLLQLQHHYRLAALSQFCRMVHLTGQWWW